LSGEQLSDPAPDPERAVVAQQELEAIKELFADDPIVTHIITGLGDGLSSTEYDSARTDPDDDGPDLTPRRQ
jgi:hypothetical protein